MEQLQQQDPVNCTAALEALAPWLNNPRRTVVRVEVLTAAVIVLLLLQLVLGSFRRQSTRFVVQAGTWVAYTVSFPLIAYTLGMMQSSPVKNVLYPVWAICLLLAAGCTNALKAYDLDDNNKWKRRFINLQQYLIYASLTCWLLYPYKATLKNYLFGASIGKPSFANATSPAQSVGLLCIIVSLTADPFPHWMAVKRYFDGELDKFIKDLELSTSGEGYDPATMRGYKYPLRIIGSSKKNFHAITIDQIWECQDMPVSSELKDVCLAFAFHEVLKRRYHGMSCMPSTEEDLRKSHDLVLEGLLRTEDGFDRAFQIVEVELGFCHDHLFTKYGSIFYSHIIWLFVFIVRVILFLRIGVIVVQNTLAIKTLNAIIEVRTEKEDNRITLLILGTILLIELLQVVLYLASDWFKVNVACEYVYWPWSWSRRLWKLAGYLNNFTIFKYYWKHRIGRCSIISDSNAGIAGDNHANMLRTVKQAIVKSLKACQGQLTNGQGSLMRNNVLENFNWALHGQSQAEIMLTWSIATDYCKVAEPMDEGGTSTVQQEKTRHKKIAVNLSRYCVHLMYSAPELLPGYFGDTTFSIREVMNQASAVRDSLDVHEKYQAMNDLENLEEDQTTFMRGVKLGKQLERMPDSVLRWKVMADFWAEKILYIAPSENVKGHMERLAKGGEFLTHIWALLTHAGIVKINRDI